ncbi:MAG: BamA/TamA family outer membrane protein [Sandaracinus sp.]|nr:BamA/TamA family outer membrane protein [Sandaracinus sp.]
MSTPPVGTPPPAPSVASTWGRAGRVGLAAILGLLGACASIPADRYGIARIELEGVEEMDERALRACLASEERDRFSIDFSGRGDPSCGTPPFEDSADLRFRMWSWPWTDWPLYDRNVFERDLQRIERWYRARGYYDARVVEARHSPSSAASRDRVDESSTCEREDDDEGCRLSLAVRVEEGEPVLVRSRALHGQEGLGETLRGELDEAWSLEIGERFDEALYDRTKQKMLRAMRERGFGCASIEGRVVVDPELRRADLAITVAPGPRCHLGEVTVTGNDDLDADVILAVADLTTGQRYTGSLLDEAQHYVYSLGAFSTVEVIGRPLRDENDACTGIVDVEIRVTPGRRLRYGLGGGVLAGTWQSGLEQQDVRQWDIHALAFVEHRNFLGGLRRIRLEARPKLVFQPVTNPFPAPRFGIDTRLTFRQPSFLERRTNLVVDARYDWGPDPIDRYFRHVLDASIALQRSFFDGRIATSFGPRGNVFIVADDDVPYASFEVLFLDFSAQLDLRDDNRRPTKGMFASLELQGAGFLSWDYVRVVPDLRGYAPLGRVVLAGRFRLGSMHIFRASDSLDPVSAALGPNPYRLRSGGASSHRGFLPGYLGDPPEASGDPDLPFTYNSGGLRRWEASVELRVPVSESFGVVAFADMGDVNRDPSFRFHYLRLAVGGGLRYDTIIGPVRFDIGVRVPNAQIVGEDDPPVGTTVKLFGLPLRGAFHLTIGEAF